MTSLQAMAPQVTHVPVWSDSAALTAGVSEQIVTTGCPSPTRLVPGNKMQSGQFLPTTDTILDLLSFPFIQCHYHYSVSIAFTHLTSNYFNHKSKT